VAFSRSSATAMATLVVYLAGLVGGGLHHHTACGRHASTDTQWQRTGHPEIWGAICDDDEDGCAICVTIDQAKAPSPGMAALTSSSPAADVVTANPTKLPLPSPVTTRARSPP